MSHGQAMRFVIVPQAVRKVIPPLLNDLIALMKDTSLVSVISLHRGRAGRLRHPGRDLQQLGADAGGDHVPDRDDPARATRRLADRRQQRRPSAAATGGEQGPVDRRDRGRSRLAWRRCERSRRRADRTAADAAAGGRPQALRRARGPARRRPRARTGRGRLRARAERLGQVDAAALHQPARAARRRAGSSSRARRSPARRADGGRRLRPPPGRDRLPAVQPVPAQVRDRERRPRAGEGARRSSRGGARPRPRHC